MGSVHKQPADRHPPSRTHFLLIAAYLNWSGLPSVTANARGCKDKTWEFLVA